MTPSRGAILEGAPGASHREPLSAVLERARLLAAGLVTYGLDPGDRVAVLGRIGIPGICGVLAVAAADGVAVPLDPALTESAWRAALIRTGARLALAEDASGLERLLALRPELPALELAFVFRPRQGDRPSPARTVEAVCADGEEALAADPGLLERASSVGTPAVFAGAGGAESRSRSLAQVEAAGLGLAKAFSATPDDVAFVAIEFEGGFDLDVTLGVLLAGGTVCPPAAVGSPIVPAFRAARPTIAVVRPRDLTTLEAAVDSAIQGRGYLGRRLAAWSLARAREAARRPRAARLARRVSLDRLVDEIGAGRLRCVACTGPSSPTEILSALGIVPTELSRGT